MLITILSAFWPGPELAVRKVVNATAQNVLGLRHGFVKCAIVRVQVMVDGGNSEEAAAAVKELTQYLLLDKKRFLPGRARNALAPIRGPSGHGGKS